MIIHPYLSTTILSSSILAAMHSCIESIHLVPSSLSKQAKHYFLNARHLTDTHLVLLHFALNLLRPSSISVPYHPSSSKTQKTSQNPRYFFQSANLWHLKAHLIFAIDEYIKAITIMFFMTVLPQGWHWSLLRAVRILASCSPAHRRCWWWHHRSRNGLGLICGRIRGLWLILHHFLNINYKSLGHNRHFCKRAETFSLKFISDMVDDGADEWWTRRRGVVRRNVEK